LKIHHQIVISFTLLSAVAILIAATVSYSLTSRMLEARLRDQTDRASRTIAQGDFVMNRAVLERLKELINADIVGISRERTILASTVDPSRERALLDEVVSVPSAVDAAAEAVVRDISVNGRPYRIAYQPLRSPEGSMVALVSDTTDMAEATSAIARTLIGVVLLVFFLVAGASQLIAKRVSNRILELAEFTRRFGSGDRNAVPVGGSDEVGQLSAAFADMAAQVLASEERLIRSEKLAVTGMLAARIAHDVRNPLSSMKMQAQLLRGRLDGSVTSQESLQAILREIDQVERVVKGLLELARPGELKLQPARINDVIDDVLRQLTPQLRHRKIAAHTRFNPLPEIDVDVDRLHQAFINLIVNGADAMPGGGTLSIETSTDRDGERVTIDICDEGGGIDPSVRSRLFDPFVSTKRDGVGLGLVNTKSIVERHGGSVELLPRDGGGTRARVTLPLHSPDVRRARTSATVTHG
jgi:signal transduction histidine kinase